MKKIKNIPVSVIVIVVAILAIAGGVYYSQRNAGETATNQPRNGTTVENEQMGTPSTTTNTTTSTSAQNTTNAKGFNYQIEELGLVMPIPAEIADLTYIVSPSNSKVVLLSSRSLRERGGITCAATYAPLGAISFEQPQPTFTTSQATCSQDKDVSDLQSRQKAAVAEAFKNIKVQN